MASNRLGRTNDDIQFALSSILRNIKDPRVNQGLISITRVEATGDLRYAKVYISVLGLRDAKEFMKGLRSAAGYIRRELAGSLSLRYTPSSRASSSTISPQAAFSGMTSAYFAYMVFEPWWSTHSSTSPPANP